MTISAKSNMECSLDTPLADRKMNHNDHPLMVKKLSLNAQLPERASSKAAGYDLFSAEDKIIPANGRAVVATDLSIALPPNTYGRVAPRSGLAVKHFIDVGAGVIDEDYRGPLGVVLFNFSDNEFQIKKGDRIAQLLIECIKTPPVLEVESLDNTERGQSGFGSTGMNEIKKCVN